MKHMKKLASLLLALVMVFALGSTAFAASGTNSNDGKITIDNAVIGQTYNIYQILELESYDTESNAYSYKATTAWANFVAQEGVKDVYLKTDDEQGYVTWIGDQTAESISAFAALAKAYAEKQTATATKKAENATLEFTNLNLGYYLVDSSLGTLCSLDTVSKEVTIKEKNGTPTIDKKVQEGEKWGTENDASIGDTVNFKATINVIDGQPKDYVMHDTMSSGLDFTPSSVKVTINGVEKTSGTDYTVTSPTTDGCTFDISFNNLNHNDVIVVTYSATLNENAVISTGTNTNKVKLEYKDTNDITHTTEEIETKTYTYQFDLVKTKNDNTLLTGAEFKLYDAETGSNEIALVKESDDVYRVATATEKDDEGFTPATIETGKVVIKGLDSGTYYLEETKAPAGYNKLAERIEVTIDKANLSATMNGNTWTAGGVHVINQTGTELPSTGGMGTTIFYVLGSTLLIGAAVLLITKKRMSAEM